MRLMAAFLLASIVSCSAFDQTYTISTFAGGALPVNIPGTSASLSIAPTGVATDAAGNVFFTNGSTSLRLDSNGILTLVAGNGTFGFSGDNGPAASAQLSITSAVAVDSAGNLYIADNNRIRKVSDGVITTIAGNGTGGFSGDNGLATSAQLNDPRGLALDSAGNLYIADAGNNGPASSAQLYFPQGIAVDSAANLYIADLVCRLDVYGSMTYNIFEAPEPLPVVAARKGGLPPH
jgi:hypothetical protein